MPNLLETLNLAALSNVEEPEIPLAELLFEGEASAQVVTAERAVVAAPSKKSQAGKSSRKSRKRQSRRASTRGKRLRAPPMQVSATQTKIFDLQSRNRASISNWRTARAADPKIDPNRVSWTGPPTTNFTPNPKIAAAKATAVELKPHQRPVLISWMDYIPVSDKNGNPEPVAKIIRMKAAARTLSIENLPKNVLGSKSARVKIEYLDEMAKFLDARQKFFDALDVSNVSGYEDLLSFLELSKESASNASNTSVVLSMLRDFALSIMSASPRLMERTENRFNGPGVNLASPRGMMLVFKETLKYSIDGISKSLGDDKQIALQLLIYQLASELKLSMNIPKGGNSKDWNVSRLVATPSSKNTIYPSASETTLEPSTTDSFGIINAISGDEPGSVSYEFPLESQDILGLTGQNGQEILTAPDFIKQLLSAPTQSSRTYNPNAGSENSKFGSLAGNVELRSRDKVVDGLAAGAATKGVTIKSGTSTGFKAEGSADPDYKTAQDAIKKFADAFSVGGGSTKAAGSSMPIALYQGTSMTIAGGFSFQSKQMSPSFLARADSGRAAFSVQQKAAPGISIPPDLPQYTDPYSEIAQRCAEYNRNINKLLNNPFGSSGNCSQKMAQTIVREVVQKLMSNLFQYKIPSGFSQSSLVQLLFLDLASKDRTISGLLHGYLAALTIHVTVGGTTQGGYSRGGRRYTGTTKAVTEDGDVVEADYKKADTIEGALEGGQGSSAPGGTNVLGGGPGGMRGFMMNGPPLLPGGGAGLGGGGGGGGMAAIRDALAEDDDDDDTGADATPEEVAAEISGDGPKGNGAPPAEPVEETAFDDGINAPPPPPAQDNSNGNGQQPPPPPPQQAESVANSELWANAIGEAKKVAMQSDIVSTVQKEETVVAESAVLVVPPSPEELAWQKLCNDTAAVIFNYLKKNGSDSTSSENLYTLSLDQISMTLQNQKNDSSSTNVLRGMTSLFETFCQNFYAGEGGVGPWEVTATGYDRGRSHANGISQTRYSKISWGNMQAAFNDATSRTVSMIFGNRYSIIKPSDAKSTGVFIRANPAVISAVTANLDDYNGVTRARQYRSFTPYKEEGPTTPMLNLERYDSKLAAIQSSQKTAPLVDPNTQGFVSGISSEVTVWDKVYSALGAEEKTAKSFMNAITKWLSTISDHFGQCRYYLGQSTVAGGMSLKQLAHQGLQISYESLDVLANIQERANKGTRIEGALTKEIFVSDDTKSFMYEQLSTEWFNQNTGNLKFISVGIPTGMLESLSQNPISLEEASRALASQLSTEYFEVKVEKIDLARPSLNYEPKTFVFPRKLFVLGLDGKASGGLKSVMQSTREMVYQQGVGAKGRKVIAQEVRDSDQLHAEYVSGSLINLKNDWALKLYSDILYSCDFTEGAFPASSTAVQEISSPAVTPIAMAKVDFQSEEFMQKSCLRFATPAAGTMSKLISQTPALALGSTKSGMDIPIINLAAVNSLIGATDPVSTVPLVSWPVTDYCLTAGAIPAEEEVETKTQLGTVFERIVCIPIDPYNFQPAKQHFHPSAARINIANAKMSESEKETSPERESASGVELSTFRASVQIPLKTKYGS